MAFWVLNLIYKVYERTLILEKKSPCMCEKMEYLSKLGSSHSRNNLNMKLEYNRAPLVRGNLA